MVNIPNAKVPTPTSTKRRRRQRRRWDTKNEDLDRRSMEGDPKEGSRQRINPNSCAAGMVNQKNLVEILREVTEGKLQKYWIFITNICAISKFCLENTPSLQSDVKDFVQHMELGDALLTFIREGPHPSLQNSLPSPWNKTNSKRPKTGPNLVKQEPESSGFGIPIGQQQSVTTAYLEGTEGQSPHLENPVQAVQRPVLADSAPIHQQFNQQPPQEHSLNERFSPTQGTAGPDFTSLRQQPPPGLNTASALALATGRQNSLPTTQFPFAVQPGQVSQCASNTVNQGSSNPVQLLPTSSAVQQYPQGSHPVMKPGTRPLMAQPLQMPNAQQFYATPLNVASKQSQTPGAHPVPAHVHAGQPTGLGWARQSQVPPTMQSHQGPVLPSSSAQPTIFSPGSQWATVPPGFTQISSQVTAPAQQESNTLPTQALSQPHGQPGTDMFTQLECHSGRGGVGFGRQCPAPAGFAAGSRQGHGAASDTLLPIGPSMLWGSRTNPMDESLVRASTERSQQGV